MEKRHESILRQLFNIDQNQGSQRSFSTEGQYYTLTYLLVETSLSLIYQYVDTGTIPLTILTPIPKQRYHAEKSEKEVIKKVKKYHLIFVHTKINDMTIYRHSSPEELDYVRAVKQQAGQEGFCLFVPNHPEREPFALDIQVQDERIEIIIREF